MTARRQNDAARAYRLGRCARAAGWVLLILAWLWCVGAIWYAPLPALARPLAVVFALALPAVLWRVRPAPLRSLTLAVAVVVLGHALIEPRHDRAWSPDQSVLPEVVIEGDDLLVRNVRFCEYRTAGDYTPRFEDRRYRLSDLRGVDFIVEPLSPRGHVAHTLMSFGFADGQRLAASVEVRKEADEVYSAVGGLFKRFELMYVFADERDVVHLRANVRGHDVFLHRTRCTPEQARALLLDMLSRSEKLRREPEFYHTLTNTCTTNLVLHLNRIGGVRVPWWNPRILLPGNSDRLAYDLGLLDTDTTFEATRERHRINTQAALYADAPDFSQRIRD